LCFPVNPSLWWLEHPLRDRQAEGEDQEADVREEDAGEAVPMRNRRVRSRCIVDHMVDATTNRLFLCWIINVILESSTYTFYKN
jgi:hypothetical protein